MGSDRQGWRWWKDGRPAFRRQGGSTPPARRPGRTPDRRLRPAPLQGGLEERVLLSPLPMVVDDIDPGFTGAGAWTTVSGRLGLDGGLNGDYLFAPASGTSTPTATASWQVAVPSAGPYEVDVSWTPYFNRASNAPYRVYDGNTLVATVRVDQRQAPAGVADDGVVYQSLGTFPVSSGALRVVLGNDADNYVIADAVHIIPAQSPSGVVDNGDAGFSTGGYWNTVAGSGGENHDFRYAPAGDGSLAASWQQAGLAPGAYDVEATWTTNGIRASNAPYRIYDGNTLLATVRVDQSQAPTGVTVNGATFQGLGTFQVNSGTLRVVLDNAADNYVIADAVRIAPPTPTAPIPIITDNSGSGYSETGTWTTVNAAAAVGGGYRVAAPGDGTTTASWQVAVPVPGSYEVDAAWTPGPDRADNAAYRIYDGNTLLATVVRDQQRPPVGPATNGVTYMSLGEYQFSNGPIRVVLGNDADGSVVADAIRVAVPDKILLSGGDMEKFDNLSISGVILPTMGHASDVVLAQNLGTADFSAYSAVWIGTWSIFGPTSSFSTLRQNLLDYLYAGGTVFAEYTGDDGVDSNVASFLPYIGQLTLSGYHPLTGSSPEDLVHILAPNNPIFAGVTDAALSAWDSSFHNTFSNIGSFTPLSEDANGHGYVTVEKTVGLGHLIITTQDPSEHIRIYYQFDSPSHGLWRYNQGAFVDNVLRLGATGRPPGQAPQRPS
jgi:hypothetical protein